MARYTITIDTDNAAFGDTDYEAQREVADILRKLADRLDNDDVRSPLRDSNGNTVGLFTISPTPENDR